MKNNKKLGVYFLIASIFIIGSMAVYYGPKVKKIIYGEDEVSQINNIDGDNKEASKNIKVRNKIEVYDEIHEMSNTLIIAVDGQRWGLKSIKQKDVERLIMEVSSSDFSDKERLLDILNRWKNRDYSKGVRDHNYVWNRLDGTVGRAVELRDKYK